MHADLHTIGLIKDIISSAHQKVVEPEAHKIIDHIWDEVSKLADVQLSERGLCPDALILGKHIHCDEVP